MIDSLSLSIQNDFLAISALLDDSRRQLEAFQVAHLDVIRIAKKHFGDDAARVDLAGFATWLDGEITNAISR